MLHLSKAIASAIISYGIAKESDRELYEYSFLILLEQFSVWVSILCTAFIFGILWETVFYMVLFIPMRIYAGGYHARTFIFCYCISVGIFLAFAIIQHYITISRWFASIIILFSAVVMSLLAPMADSNKPISTLEESLFTSRIRSLIFLELLIAVFVLIINITDLFAFVSFSFFHLALLLVIGKLKNKSKVA